MSALANSVSRRRFLLGTTAVAGAAAMAACGGQGSTSDSSGTVRLQVTVWLGADEVTAMKKLLTRFNKAHPGIDVQMINIVNGGPYGSTKLQQMIAGGTPPDLMMLNSGQFESLAARKALAPLDDLVAKHKVDLGVYWPQSVTGCRFDGKLYGLPKDISNVIVYLNTSLFDKAKVAVPSADWSWEEYRSAAKELTAKLNTGTKVTKWGTVLVNADWSWSPFVWTNGGEVYQGKQCLVADPKAQQGLDFYFGLRVKDKAAPSSGALASFGTQSAELNAFLGGAIGFGIFGPWLRPGLIDTAKFDWTIRPVPKGPQGQPAVIPVFTDMWGMSASTKHKEEASTLLTWLTGEAGQQAWLDIYGGRSITPIKKLTLSNQWLDYGGKAHRVDNQAILDQLVPDRNRRPAVAFGGGAEAETLWDNEFKVVLAGQESVAQATQKVCSRLTTILERSS